MSLPEGLTSSPPSVPDTIIAFPSPHILLVTLNRPSHLNAIPTTSHALFDALWRWYDNQPTLRCAVLTGTGRAFCAGADLKQWNNSHQDAGGAPGRDAKWAPSGFAGLSNRAGKKPVVAAVNGICMGGGMEIAANCDLVVAAEAAAAFSLPEAKRGVVVLAGALPRLVRTVGLQRASEMALLGRTYDAATMSAWGLVNFVVPRGGDVVAAALEVALEVCGNSPDSVIVNREGLRLGWEAMGPERATEVLEKGMYGRVEAGENMVEGVMSFVEKRKPVWRDSKL